MNKKSAVYEKLAQKFSAEAMIGPSADDALLLELLNHCFTADEAEIAFYLPFFYKSHPLEKVAREADVDPAHIKPLLDNMVKKGLIRGRGKGYALLPILPGMFENVLMEGDDTSWHREFARIANRLYETGYVRKYLEHPTRIARSIPIGVSLDAASNAVDHDSVEKMIRAHDMLAVLNNCQCRHAHFLEGRECRRADRLDGCLAFGNFARLYIERGGARQVSRDTMRSIVEDRREKKLLFLAGNVMPESTNHICTCCDCCCHMLGQIISYDPGLIISPPKYLVTFDDDRCTNCGKCLAACNLLAHTMTGKRHVFDQKRCIGCGLCLGVCESLAIELVENNNYKKPAKSFKHLAVRLAPSKMMAILKTKLKRKEKL